MNFEKNYIEIANQYAEDVVSGAVDACRFTKLACERHLKDLEKQNSVDFPYVFCPLMQDSTGVEYVPGVRICAFAEKMKHVKGKWKGQFLVLEPWQVFLLTVLFGWVHVETGLRRFKESYIKIPRKNGKSIIGAIIGLYMFSVDLEGGAEVFSGATTEKQAWEVFRPARLMAKGSLPFRKKYKIKVHAKKLTTSDGSFFEPLIGDPGDGASPHCAIIDEFHEHKTPNQFDTMDTGSGARSQPLLAVITTAGSNLAGPCYEKEQQAAAILEGHFTNEQFFTIMYGIDKGDDWQDFDNWRKANPNLGVSIYEDYLKGRLQTAKQTTSKCNVIQCKHLNKWMTTAVAWMDLDKWAACEDKTIKESDFIGKDCYAALDLAAKIDMCARVKIYIGDDDKRYMFSHFYLPAATAQDPSKTHYLQWVQDGFIDTNPGATVDFDKIEDHIYDDIIEKLVRELCYDPYQATQMYNHLYQKLSQLKSDAEVEEVLIEVRPTVLNFSEPMKELQKLIYEKKIIHNGNPVMNWMMGNVVCFTDNKDNIYPRKEQEKNKIDGPVAAIMANSRAMHHVEKIEGNDGSLLNI